MSKPIPKTMTRFVNFDYQKVVSPPVILPESAKAAPLTNPLSKNLKGIPSDIDRPFRPATKERKEKNYHGFRIPDFEQSLITSATNIGNEI